MENINNENSSISWTTGARIKQFCGRIVSRESTTGAATFILVRALLVAQVASTERVTAASESAGMLTVHLTRVVATAQASNFVDQRVVRHVAAIGYV